MKRTTFHIQEMDCPSEEQAIRLRLGDIEGIAGLDFDLSARSLDVFHEGPREEIGKALQGLSLGAREVEHQEGVELRVPDAAEDDEEGDRVRLKWALAINATLFVGELLAGLLARSMGLVADSLDMLADACVYALSLAAVGGTAARKRRLAAASGYVQGGLALLGLAEVSRRFAMSSSAPDPTSMVLVSLVALAANVATLLLLRGTRRGAAHIEASWIFTSNDIKVNLLVIFAALLVWWTSSQVPDLIAGGLIFLIVANGARRILALARDV